MLNKIVALNKQEFQGFNGYLFKSWLQFDEEDPTYVLYVGRRKFSVVLDDGRGTSERAKNCKIENLFDEDPVTGCSIMFDGEYVVDDNGGVVEVKMKIWNVSFK